MNNPVNTEFFKKLRRGIIKRRNKAAINAIDKGNDDMKLFKDIRLQVKLIWIAIAILAILNLF